MQEIRVATTGHGPAGWLDRERTVARAGFNRWLVPPAALAIHLCIGMAYGLSVFWLPLTHLLGGARPVTCPAMTTAEALFTTSCDWRIADVTWIFELAIVVLGCAAAGWGGWLERVGPRRAGVVAALCWSVGWLVSALGIAMHQLWLMWLGTGVLGGAGLGIGYISPVSTLIKWFPDRRGMATGMAIMGFGGGAMIGAPLANLLMNLLERAKLTRAQPGQVPRIADQYAEIRKAAMRIELDVELPLSKYLCTYPPALPEFMQRIGRTPVGRFKQSRRPHGLLIGVATEAAEGRIVPALGDPFDVSGEIAIFGEEDGHAQERRTGARERAPYVMACVVGRRHPDEDVTVLRAYLHPCAKATWLLPVDSNHERGTLKQILSVGHWLADKRGVELTIEKPVFDLAPPSPRDDGKAPAPHEPIIPDFIVRASSGRSVVVETMGYELPAYRERKARMHRAVSKACQDAPIMGHDFCLPAEWSQEERDAQFWRVCQRALGGRACGQGRRPSDEPTAPAPNGA